MNKFDDIKLMNPDENSVIFYPHINTVEACKRVTDVLYSRWIGEGAEVEKFEREFKKTFQINGFPVALNSGTSGLHLAYILAGIQAGDEVIVPVFTCTATSTPLLWMGAKIIFADCDNNLNISWQDVARKVNKKTKAIVCVHYGGVPCDMDELFNIAQSWNIPIIEDAAQCLGGTYKDQKIGNISEYTCFSFQSTKTLTTGDGGMLIVPTEEKAEKAKRLRWFGIDRKKKQQGIWENDITEIGYKYHMTNIDAAIGLAGLNVVHELIEYRKKLFRIYLDNLENVRVIHSEGNACWLCTIIVEGNRKELIQKLSENHIESGVIHYRNDQYTIFGGRQKLENMDRLEDKYLVLPLHTKLTENDVLRICETVNKYT